MSDNADKRAPRTFEPPPWERDAFEGLARKREAEAEEVAARESAEAQKLLQTTEALNAQAADASVPAAVKVEELIAEGGVSARDGIEEAKVAEMLAGLSLEEPRMEASGHAGVAAGAVLGALGLGMIGISVWLLVVGQQGATALGPLVMMSITMGGFGLGFAALGGLMLYRSRLQARS